MLFCSILFRLLPRRLGLYYPREIAARADFDFRAGHLWMIALDVLLDLEPSKLARAAGLPGLDFVDFMAALLCRIGCEKAGRRSALPCP
jgi:hypothetical protein